MGDAPGEKADLSSFTNDSAMMIAYERALETARGDDALFSDPLAAALAGEKGQSLSVQFGEGCAMFELSGWPDFHRQWTAVRTKYIDDAVAKYSASLKQCANLGAGCDTRPYRLASYAAFKDRYFEADMAVINANKAKMLELLGDEVRAPHCGPAHVVDIDFLDTERTLATALPAPFDVKEPTLFLAEGLIMYLGAEGKIKLLRDVSTVAAPGSVFILQFSDPSESALAKAHPETMAGGLTTQEAVEHLTTLGWKDLVFAKFGDETLNFGRFPTDKFKPCAGFSFVIATKV